MLHSQLPDRRLSARMMLIPLKLLQLLFYQKLLLGSFTSSTFISAHDGTPTPTVQSAPPLSKSQSTSVIENIDKWRRQKVNFPLILRSLATLRANMDSALRSIRHLKPNSIQSRQLQLPLVGIIVFNWAFAIKNLILGILLIIEQAVLSIIVVTILVKIIRLIIRLVLHISHRLLISVITLTPIIQYGKLHSLFNGRIGLKIKTKLLRLKYKLGRLMPKLKKLLKFKRFHLLSFFFKGKELLSWEDFISKDLPGFQLNLARKKLLMLQEDMWKMDQYLEDLERQYHFTLDQKRMQAKCISQFKSQGNVTSTLEADKLCSPPYRPITMHFPGKKAPPPAPTPKYHLVHYRPPYKSPAYHRSSYHPPPYPPHLYPPYPDPLTFPPHSMYKSPSYQPKPPYPQRPPHRSPFHSRHINHSTHLARRYRHSPQRTLTLHSTH